MKTSPQAPNPKDAKYRQSTIWGLGLRVKDFQVTRTGSLWGCHKMYYTGDNERITAIGASTRDLGIQADFRVPVGNSV